MPADVNYKNKKYLEKNTNIHLDRRARFTMDNVTSKAHTQKFQVKLDSFPNYKGILGPSDWKKVINFFEIINLYRIFFFLGVGLLSCIKSKFIRPRGPMDKASVFGTEDCRFESCRGQFNFISFLVL